MKKIKNTLGRNLQKAKGADKISEEKRSENMSRIRSRGTKFEKDFLAELDNRLSESYTLNDKTIRGKPDIVFKDKKVLVFLDSDFWHGWQFPRWKHLLKNDFWVEKISRNRLRDRRTSAFLRRKGWNVIRIWEHNIKRDIKKEINRILRALM